jgi:hypothetical protein
VEKKAYQEKVDALLKKESARIDDLMARAGKAGAAADKKGKELLNDLKKKREVADKKYKELKQVRGEAWKDLKAGVDDSAKKLKSAINDVIKAFKS